MYVTRQPIKKSIAKCSTGSQFESKNTRVNKKIQNNFAISCMQTITLFLVSF